MCPPERHREVPSDVRVVDGKDDPSTRARAEDQQRARLAISHADPVGGYVALLVSPRPLRESI